MVPRGRVDGVCRPGWQGGSVSSGNLGATCGLPGRGAELLVVAQTRSATRLAGASACEGGEPFAFALFA